MKQVVQLAIGMLILEIICRILIYSFAPDSQLTLYYFSRLLMMAGPFILLFTYRTWYEPDTVPDSPLIPDSKTRWFAFLLLGSIIVLGSIEFNWFYLNYISEAPLTSLLEDRESRSNPELPAIANTFYAHYKTIQLSLVFNLAKSGLLLIVYTIYVTILVFAVPPQLIDRVKRSLT